MSPINSALQYKIQKMERQLSSLMEENVALRNIINEANLAAMSPTQAFNYGGGAALGQHLAGQPNVGYVGTVGDAPTARLNNLTNTSTGAAPASGSAPALAQAQTGGGGGFDGAAFGQFLAGLGNNPQAQQMLAAYLAQFPTVSGAQTAPSTRRNNNLSTRSGR
jgi:hypothetical protein